ncbi:type IV pilus biogenesis/stability protein PilW [uncultured Vibrio sp.]|uniref:type IV pilus biogenesis/stability protein PilW n=1 Tax=uncultured Vibrio sp. TaxID=114054 RepID=UPI00091FB973|nr:type IV pilus biogenesis/stability protein PilW [uncultured Vibrio sp.]OIQ26202.1 MAG: type IV pilus biogenesis/stability protein PilW [Vibrio sp. MedPE-SWchi]
MKQTLSALLLTTLVGCVTVTDGGEPIASATSIEKAETRVALGLGYLQQGNMIKARENLESAMKHAPNYYRTQLSMAHYYDAVGEPQAAKKMYQLAVRQNPKNGDVLNNYGTFLCKQNEFGQADHYFKQAIKQTTYYRSSDSYENAAFCALKAGNDRLAEVYFKRTLDHDPNRTRSLLQLAKLEIERDQFTQARLRLLNFHQQFGIHQASLSLLIDLESKAGNTVMSERYQEQLNTLIEQRS